MKFILSGDIGGTNSRFRLYQLETEEILLPADKTPLFSSLSDLSSVLVFNKRYENKDFKSFMDVLRVFLIEAGVQEQEPPITACFAVAGPVQDNIVRFTNRDQWHVDGGLVSREMNIPLVRLVNDFLAVGYGLLTLDEERECVTLQSAPKVTTSPIACIGPGTGLGECFLAPNSDGTYECFPSEGGHAEFAPRNEIEIGLLRFLKDKFGQQHRISVERVVSGPGLVNIYEYLIHAFPELADSALHEKIMAAGEMKGAVIAAHPENELCRQTMAIFATAYGAEAGVAALKWLPLGGLYLTGGLTPKNLSLIRDPMGPFMTAFRDKGRVSGMLSAVPVYAVLVDDLGERGAHFVATKLLYERQVLLLSDRKHGKNAENTLPSKCMSGECAQCGAVASVSEGCIPVRRFGVSWTSAAAGAGVALLLVWLRNKM